MLVSEIGIRAGSAGVLALTLLVMPLGSGCGDTQQQRTTNQDPVQETQGSTQVQAQAESPDQEVSVDPDVEGGIFASLPSGQFYTYAYNENITYLRNPNAEELAALEGEIILLAPDGRTVTKLSDEPRGLASSIKDFQLWDPNHEKISVDFEGSFVSFGPDGSVALYVEDTDTTHLVDADSQEIAQFAGPVTGVSENFKLWITESVVPAEPGRLSDDDKEILVLWNDQGEELHRIEAFGIQVFVGYSFSPDQHHLVTYVSETFEERNPPAAAQVWDLEGEQLLEVEGDFNYFISDTAFSISTFEEPPPEDAFFVEGEEKIVTLQGEELRVEGDAQAMSAEGQIVSTRFTDDGTEQVLLWESVSSDPVSLDEFFLELLPNGRVLTRSEGGNEMIIRDFTGTELARLETGEDVGLVTNYAEVTPDQQRLVTTNGADTILWDLEGQQLASFEGEFSDILPFLEDGRLVISAQEDNQIRLIDLDP